MGKNSRDQRASVGVFDSGVGGLTVAREIMRNLPNEHIVYFGDTARVPYGSKSKDTIVRYSRQIIHFLRTQDVKAIVIACNTASALALDEVERELDIPILGVIKPGARVAVEATRNHKIGVIGTESTINSHMYKRLICEADPSITVYEKACPLLCPLVEEGWLKDPVTEEVAKRYLDGLLGKGIDSLILGCTHYPLLRSLIREIAGDQITLVNPAYETAKELGELLEREQLGNPDAPDEPRTAEPYRFFVSDMADKFGSFANSILPYDIETIQKINIEDY
ncbi:MAG: glutamate racemase [Lachnospiraceae bacterium]|nr:glutamate racemase [Lachnospiraceae bacterium]